MKSMRRGVEERGREGERKRKREMEKGRRRKCMSGVYNLFLRVDRKRRRDTKS